MSSSPRLPPRASMYHSHATAEEAEAEGWRFDETLGRWLPPPHIRDKYKIGRCRLTPGFRS